MREDAIRSAVAIGPSKGMAVVGLTLTVLAASLVILLSLWAGPLVPRADVFVSAHMILHLGIVSIAAPLIALAIALMPGVITAGLFGARSAIAASLFDMLVVWLWHAAVLHQAAVLNDGVFVFQQASFLAAGLLVWTTALSGRTTRDRAIGSATLLGTFLHMTMLDVILGVTPRLLYSPSVCIGAFGVSGVEDQWFGGVLMATVGALPYLACACC